MTECFICDKQYNDQLNKPQTLCPCGHVICESCINVWMHDKKTCPKCRQKIDRLELNGDILTFLNKENDDDNKNNAADEAMVQNEPGPQIDNVIRRHRTNKLKQNEVISDKCEYAIYVIDNSGSMDVKDGKIFELNNNNQIIKKGRIKRWHEAGHKIEEIAKYNVLRRIPATYYLLNPESRKNGAITDWIEDRDFVKINALIDNENEIKRKLNVLNDIMKDSNVRGGTPLAKVTKAIRLDLMNNYKHKNDNIDASGNNNNNNNHKIIETPICFNIITDGDPNSKSEFEKELKLLINEYETFLVINLCTDSDSTINYYNDLDTTLGNDLSGMDVIDDFEGELDEIYEYNKFLIYSYDMHLCRMAGCFSIISDLLDEKKLGKYFTLQLCENLCKIHINNNIRIPDWKNDKENYFNFIEKEILSLEQVYDYKNKNFNCPIHLQQIEKIIFGKNSKYKKKSSGSNNGSNGNNNNNNNNNNSNNGGSSNNTNGCCVML